MAATSRLVGVRIAAIIALCTLSPQAVTVTGVSNTPDPFDNASQTTSITVTTSAADDMIFAIYNLNGDSLIDRIYSNTAQNNVTQSWDGKGTAVPAYATPVNVSAGTYRIRAYTHMDMQYSTAIAGTGLIIDDSYDMARDDQGNLYITESSKGLVFKVDTTGKVIVRIVLHDVNCGTDSLTGMDMQGIAVDGSYNVYLSDGGARPRIAKINATGDYTTGTAVWNTTTVTTPRGMFWYGSSLWLADPATGAQRIKEFNSSGAGTTRASVNGCRDVCTDGTYYYVSEINTTDEIRSYRLSDNSLVANWQAGVNKNSDPLGVDIAGGYLMVTCRADNQVWRYPVVNGVSTAAGRVQIGNNYGSDSGYVDNPRGAAIIGAKYAFIDRGNKRIQFFSTATTLPSKIFWTDANTPLDPSDIAVDRWGNIYVASRVLDCVKKYNSSGVRLCDIGSSGAALGELNQPMGVAVDTSGNVYISDYLNNRVQKFIRVDDTTYQYNAGSGSWSATLTEPIDMAYGPDNRVYVLSQANNNNSVQVYGVGSATPQTSISEGTMLCNNKDAGAIALDYQNNVYVANIEDFQIQKGTMTGANAWSFATLTNTGDQYLGLASDPFGNILASDINGTAYVRLYAPGGSEMWTSAASGTGNGQFREPTGIAYTNDGQYAWIVDRLNDRVQKLNVVFDNYRDELVTVGSSTGRSRVMSVSLRRTSNDSTLLSPVSTLYNSAGAGVTVSVSFNEIMDTSYTPIMRLVDVNSNQYTITPRSGATWNTSGWIKAQRNIWEGSLDIPTGNDGVARVYVKDARSSAGATDTMLPNPNDSFTVTIDAATQMPTISDPSSAGTTIEQYISVSGLSEANAVLSVYNYDAASGGTVLSSQSNVTANGSGSWTANSIALSMGDNYLCAQAVDRAGNTSTLTTPRVPMTRVNVLPGAMTLSPAGELEIGSASQWTLRYTAASTLNDACFLTLLPPPGWTSPQRTSTSAPGYVRAVGGPGTVLHSPDTVDIISGNTLRVNIVSMSNNQYFDIVYGLNPSGNAQITSTADCGLNSFYTGIHTASGTAYMDPRPCLHVRGNPLKVYPTNKVAAQTFYGQPDLNVMDLSFNNAAGLKSAEVNRITLRTERQGAAAVAANTRITSIVVRDANEVYGQAVPTGSSDVTIDLSTPIAILAGDTVTVQVYVDCKADVALVNDSLRLKLVDSTLIRAVEASSQDSIPVKVSGAATFPMVSNYTKFKSASHPDSITVRAIDILPDTLGNQESEVSALRLVFGVPTPAAANNAEIRRIALSLSGNPNTIASRKILRRKGQTTNLYASTSIETANPMVFDLTFSPIYVAQGVSDTIDVLFDMVSSPPATVSFTITRPDSVQTWDAVVTTSTVTSKGTGTTYPFTTKVAKIMAAGTTPSGKTIDGSLADWTPATEMLDQCSVGGDSLLVTWDNANLYVVWRGTTLSTMGDLFVYMSTGVAGGANVTWNHGGNGYHNITTDFGGADYLYYYADAGDKGLLSGASGYALTGFGGSVVVNGSVTEIRIPRANIGNPTSLKLFACIQNEGSAAISSVIPYNGLSAFQRNPIGNPTQTFIGWINIAAFNRGVTPLSQSSIAASTAKTPVWTYDAGAGNAITGLTVGYDVVYVSMSGTTPGVAAVRYSDKVQLWKCATPAAVPTPVTYFWNETEDIVAWGAGASLFVVRDSLIFGKNNYSHMSYSPKAMTFTVGAPAMSMPADVDAFYCVTSDGKLNKVNYATGATTFSVPAAGANANYLADIYTKPTVVYVGCTDGRVRGYATADGSLAATSANYTSSINKGITVNETNGTLYMAPNDNYLRAERTASIGTTKWSIDLGSTTGTAPFCDFNNPAGPIYVGAGQYMYRVLDNTTGASIASPGWTYSSTDVITSNPIALDSVVYFGCDDKRLFAVSAITGTAKTGWPSTPLGDKTNVRVAVDNTYGIVYFGTADGKVYCFTKEAP